MKTADRSSSNEAVSQLVLKENGRPCSTGRNVDKLWLTSVDVGSTSDNEYAKKNLCGKLRFEGPKCFDAMNLVRAFRVSSRVCCKQPCNLFASWCWVKHDTKMKDVQDSNCVDIQWTDIRVMSGQKRKELVRERKRSNEELYLGWHEKMWVVTQTNIHTDREYRYGAYNKQQLAYTIEYKHNNSDYQC